MTQDMEYTNHWTADEGKVLINSAGAFGTEIWLGVGDDIANWHEVDAEEVEGAESGE